MTFKIITFLFSFNIIVSSMYSQMRLQEDSLRATSLISEKVKSLEYEGAVNILHMFSDVGSIMVIYQMNNKTKAVKSYYKEKKSSKFRNLKLSKENKSNYNKCISLVRNDSIVSLSNCKEFVHSFNTIFFNINTNRGIIKGRFTSDCVNVLEINDMHCLFSLYKKFLH